MKPKKTFRDARLKSYFRGAPRHDDAELDAELAATLSIWRAKYQRFKDRTFNPPMMDVRATLQALAEIPDDRADKAVRLLDSHTFARIKHAAWLDYRQQFPEPAPIPPGALSIRQVVAGRVVMAISPSRLRELAALAVSVLPKDTGGRTPINSLDHLFVCELVHHWLRIHGTEPTIDCVGTGNFDGTEFMRWVCDMFWHIGVEREKVHNTIYPKDQRKVLRDAINEVIKKG